MVQKAVKADAPATNASPSRKIDELEKLLLSATPGKKDEIEAKAREAGARVVGRVRYDSLVTRAQIQEKAVVDTDCPCAEDIREVWRKLALQ